jgi:hypothetical protein
MANAGSFSWRVGVATANAFLAVGLNVRIQTQMDSTNPRQTTHGKFKTTNLPWLPKRESPIPGWPSRLLTTANSRSVFRPDPAE